MSPGCVQQRSSDVVLNALVIYQLGITGNVKCQTVKGPERSVDESGTDQGAAGSLMQAHDIVRHLSRRPSKPIFFALRNSARVLDLKDNVAIVPIST